MSNALRPSNDICTYCDFVSFYASCILKSYSHKNFLLIINDSPANVPPSYILRHPWVSEDSLDSRQNNDCMLSYITVNPYDDLLVMWQLTPTTMESVMYMNYLFVLSVYTICFWIALVCFPRQLLQIYIIGDRCYTNFWVHASKTRYRNPTKMEWR